MKFTKNLVKQKVGTMLITKLKTFVDHIEQLFYSLEELNFSFLVCVCLGQKLENDPISDMYGLWGIYQDLGTFLVAPD